MGERSRSYISKAILKQSFVVLLTTLIFVQNSWGQTDRFTSQPIIWASGTGTVTFSDAWSAKANVQQRQFIQTKGSFQLLASATLLRKFSGALSSAIGFMFFDFRRLELDEVGLIHLSELRPYEYVTLLIPAHKSKVTTRFLFEQRFQKWLTDDGVSPKYRLNHRFRFRLETIIPLRRSTMDSPFSLTLSDEPMINFGPNIVHNTFDQNRLIGMVNYKIQKNLSVGTGYMNWIFQKSSGDSFDVRHVWLLQLSHEISL